MRRAFQRSQQLLFGRLRYNLGGHHITEARWSIKDLQPILNSDDVWSGALTSDILTNQARTTCIFADLTWNL